jgi:hypothetical protein
MPASRLLRALCLVGVLAGAFGGSACVTVRAAPLPSPPPPPPPPRATVVPFYDELAPHGEWIFVPRFGHVWRPWRHVVGIGFIPYSTGGHWEYTRFGWVFVSDWEWGRTVFHYGRWFHLHGQGWLWMPGTVWGPAWVEWRYGGGYVGWAPLPPPRISVIVSTYRPIWHVVPAPYFPHRHHVRRLLPEHQATAVGARAPALPPRSPPARESWHVSTPPPAVRTEPMEELRPRRIPRAEPPAPSVLPRSVQGGDRRYRGVQPSYPRRERVDTQPQIRNVARIRPRS